MKIPFNIPYISGKEKIYMTESIANSSSGGYKSFKGKCLDIIEREWNIKNVYLTNSCTAALEACAMLIDIRPGDEVIVPSWTFPSTANAFIRQGARIVLADCKKEYPVIDEDLLESLITPRTRAIVPVHYGGVACDMDKIMSIAARHDLFVVEDAAHAAGSYYKGRHLGSIGHLGCLSFHRSKNIQCEEGGAIIINDDRFSDRVPRILEKGTDRHDFLSGKKKYYEWVDIGSSFGITELHAAFLAAQLEDMYIIENRKKAWDRYYSLLKNLSDKNQLRLPEIPDFAKHNAHIFFVVIGEAERNKLKTCLTDIGIGTAYHYVPLHRSEYSSKSNPAAYTNANSDMFSGSLLRLPLYNEMTLDEVGYVVSSIEKFFDREVC